MVVFRFETGDRALRDVELRRRLADALDLPVEIFGLYGPHGPKVGGTASEGDDVRRRAFLVAAGGVMVPAGQPLAKAEVSSTGSVQVLTQRVEGR